MWKLDIRTTSSIRSNIDTGITLAATKLALMLEYCAFDEVREMSYTARKLFIDYRRYNNALDEGKMCSGLRVPVPSSQSDHTF